MKKSVKIITSLVLALAMVLSVNTVYAADVDENKRVHDRIEELYAERARLTVNWAENESRINEIDDLVAELGVTNATEEDLAKIYNNSKARVTVVGECYGTNVTQERYVTNYNGSSMELQIIRVVPEGAYGEMYHSAVTEEKKISSVDAASNVFFECVVPAGVGFTPTIGTSLSLVITGAQMLSQMNKELNCKTLQASSYYDYTATSSEVWVYVKHAGSTDANQKLCYNGNIVYYEGRYISKGLLFEGNTPKFTRYEDVINGYVKSPNYDNCANIAKKNFFYYSNYKTSFNPEEHVSLIKVTMNNQVYRIIFNKTGFPMRISN